MRTKATLLVLGAGASRPFRFPVGDELRDQIASGPKTRWWLRQCGFSESECDCFCSAFVRSGFSIDGFLARRHEFEKIGKVAIAACLLPKEEDAGLYYANERPGHSDWYQRLWRALVGTAMEPLDLTSRRLKVITFNYDRSLERYLHLTAMASFGLSATDAYALVSTFFPYHVYGQIGPYTADSMFAAPDPEHMLAAAANLKVMPTTRPQVDDECRERLMEADQIYFLGFAFDPMNCSTLGLQKVCEERFDHDQPSIHATSLGLLEKELPEVSRRLTGHDDRVNFLNLPAAQAMDHWAIHFV